MLLFQLLNNSEHFNQPNTKNPSRLFAQLFCFSLLLQVTLHKLPGNCVAWYMEPDSQNSWNPHLLRHKGEAEKFLDDKEGSGRSVKSE